MTPAEIDQLAARARAAPAPPGLATRIVAIDGHGGAGKSTLAAQLAAALDGAPVVHTDDFASWEVPLDWWPRLVEQVLQPLTEGRLARYQRYDWSSEALAEWIDLPAAEVIVLEGVSASRREFRPYLAFAVWVDTPVDVCVERGLARDGEDQRELWMGWLTAEDAYIARDQPQDHADVVVSGL